MWAASEGFEVHELDRLRLGLLDLVNHTFDNLLLKEIKDLAGQHLMEFASRLVRFEVQRIKLLVELIPVNQIFLQGSHRNPIWHDDAGAVHIIVIAVWRGVRSCGFCDEVLGTIGEPRKIGTK